MDRLPELRSLISALAGDERRPQVPGVTVFSSPTTSEPLGGVMKPALALVAQGRKRAVNGDRIFDYGAGQYLVVSVDLPITSAIVEAGEREPFLAFGLSLRPEVIAGLALETGSVGRDPIAPPGMAMTDADDDLLDPVIRLLRLMSSPRDLAVLAPAIEREIHWRLMTGPQGATVRQIGIAGSALSHVSRAIAIIRARYAEPLRIDDLAREVGMSVSSLNRHFRAVTATSPLQYQKLIRLQEARMLLIAAPDDIAAVGYQVGYDSPSQFSREYRRMFGAPPGQDAARLRIRPEPASI